MHKSYTSELARRGLVAKLHRAGIGDPDPGRRIEIGEVDTGHHGRVRVALDHGAGALVVHGVAVDINEIDADLRRSLIAAAAMFTGAKDPAHQTSAKTLIGTVVAAILDRHDELHTGVFDARRRERFSV